MNLRTISTCAWAMLVASQVQAQPPAPGRYAIDADASAVHWLVYSAGPAARFGHNHVISVGTMTGRVDVAPEWSDSTFELDIPVDALVVDDPALRAAQAEGFDSTPDADDIDGTRANMLSERVLDGAAHPLLRVVGSNPTGAPASSEMTLEIEVAGQSPVVTAPVRVEADGDVLVASGEFRLTHAQLGLEPFSIMLGALQVGSDLDFRYRIAARRSSDR